jgi:BMFP domain-containing protein YqiC
MENLDKHTSKKKHEYNKTSLTDKISSALVRMDLLLKENFELKREIVFERKKYVDLQQSYQDLKSSMS